VISNHFKFSLFRVLFCVASVLSDIFLIRVIPPGKMFGSHVQKFCDHVQLTSDVFAAAVVLLKTFSIFGFYPPTGGRIAQTV
jgi:hypothetical protein